MGKPQITVRLYPSLLIQLDQYIDYAGTSQTSEIAPYLGYTEKVSLSQRMTEVEKRLAGLEAEKREN